MRGGRLLTLGHRATRAEAEAERAAHHPDAVADPEAPPLPELERQLAEYFAGRRRDFDLPLEPIGTDFQQRCWRALVEIPYGETRTYAAQAAAVGRPGAFRAVGRANHDNPIAVVIPCHRVVGSNGSLTGYAGGLDLKRRLLELEGALPRSLDL